MRGMTRLRPRRGHPHAGLRAGDGRPRARVGGQHGRRAVFVADILAVTVATAQVVHAEPLIPGRATGPAALPACDDPRTLAALWLETARELPGSRWPLVLSVSRVSKVAHPGSEQERSCRATVSSRTGEVPITFAVHRRIPGRSPWKVVIEPGR